MRVLTPPPLQTDCFAIQSIILTWLSTGVLITSCCLSVLYTSYQQYQQVLLIFRVFLRYSPCRAIELPRSKNIITAVR